MCVHAPCGLHDTGKANSSSSPPPHPPRTIPFLEGKSITGVTYGVLLWADMNAATPLGAWGCAGVRAWGRSV